MRKILLGGLVLIASLQVWPTVFGHRASISDTAVAAPRDAGAAVAVRDGEVADAAPPLMSCYRHQRIAAAACAPGDTACRRGVVDRWDLCEATGLWSDPAPAL